MFERYVNFEFYKTLNFWLVATSGFERYVNFEFYKTQGIQGVPGVKFERYVNFEFYKTKYSYHSEGYGLRDM